MSPKRNSSRPAPGSRGWIHPSELGRVDGAGSPVRRVRPSLSLALVLVLAGGAWLLVSPGSPPRGESVTAHRVPTLGSLPMDWRGAAFDAVVVAGAHGRTPGFVVSSALVVATAAVGDAVRVRSLGPARDTARYLGRDPATGLRVWRLDHAWPVSEFGPLPYDTTATALVATWRGARVSGSWGTTTVGDPRVSVRGPLRVMTESAPPELRAPDGTVALDRFGRATAMLTAGRWWPLTTLARVARVVETNGSCRVRWFDRGEDAPGGGVLVTRSTTDSVRAGDVITRFNGDVVESWAQLQSDLYLTTRGSLATWVRDRGGHVRADGARLPCSP